MVNLDFGNINFLNFKLLWGSKWKWGTHALRQHSKSQWSRRDHPNMVPIPTVTSQPGFWIGFSNFNNQSYATKCQCNMLWFEVPCKSTISYTRKRASRIFPGRLPWNELGTESDPKRNRMIKCASATTGKVGTRTKTTESSWTSPCVAVRGRSRVETELMEIIPGDGFAKI